MIEKLKGIYEIKMQNDNEAQGVTIINIYIIPGKKGERSLLVDCGFRKDDCMDQLDNALKDLGIKYEDLDVFITHRHFDHCSLARTLVDLGASIYMNKCEERHSYDCLTYRPGKRTLEEQEVVLKKHGVTKELELGAWKEFERVNDTYVKNGAWFLAIDYFPYTDIAKGDHFDYGDFHFEVYPLKGHTYGQMGLIEREKKILFTADQVIMGVSPIVATTFSGENLLESFFESIKEIKKEFKGWTLLPAHGDIIYDVDKAVDHILFAYKRKINEVRNLLEMAKYEMTVIRIACEIYDFRKDPKNAAELFFLKMIMTKTSSILEYLYSRDEIYLREKDGIFYYKGKSCSNYLE